VGVRECLGDDARPPTVIIRAATPRCLGTRCRREQKQVGMWANQGRALGAAVNPGFICSPASWGRETSEAAHLSRKTGSSSEGRQGPNDCGGKNRHIWLLGKTFTGQKEANGRGSSNVPAPRCEPSPRPGRKSPNGGRHTPEKGHHAPIKTHTWESHFRPRRVRVASANMVHPSAHVQNRGDRCPFALGPKRAFAGENVKSTYVHSCVTGRDAPPPEIGRRSIRNGPRRLPRARRPQRRPRARPEWSAPGRHGGRNEGQGNLPGGNVERGEVADSSGAAPYGLLGCTDHLEGPIPRCVRGETPRSLG